MLAGQDGELAVVRQLLDVFARPEAPRDEHARPVRERDPVRALAVADDKQAPRVDIARHLVQLHRADDELMKRLVQAFAAAQQAALHDLQHLGERELLGVAAPLAPDPHRADPFLGADVTGQAGLLERPVGRSLRYFPVLRHLPYGDARADRQISYVFEQLLVLGQFIPGFIVARHSRRLFSYARITI